MSKWGSEIFKISGDISITSDQIAKLAEFYDYYEIQPLGNNRFMIESDRIPDVNSDEDLKNINREIVELGRNSANR